MPFDELLRYADEYYSELDGSTQAYLSEDEVRYLTIRKGSLDADERLEFSSPDRSENEDADLHAAG